MMTWFKVILVKVMRRNWIMYIYFKVEQIGFAERLDDKVKEEEGQ